MAYGNAQRLGQTIDPSLMRADYSGYANAGAILGNTLANVGQQIGETIKINKQNEREIKKYEQMAKAIRDAIPELAPMADNALAELNNPDLTTNQKLAIAAGIQDSLKIGVLGLELRSKTQGGSMWSITPQRADAYRKAGYKLEIIGENPDGTLIVKTAQGQGVGSGGVIPIQTENGIIFQQQPPPSYAPTPSSFNNNNYPDGVDIGNAMPVENGGTWGVTQAGEVGDLPSDNVKAINIRAGNQSEMPLNPVDTERFDNPLIGVNTNVADNIQSAQNLPTTPVPTGDVWRLVNGRIVAGQVPYSMQDLEAQQKKAELEKTKLETQKMQGEQAKESEGLTAARENFSNYVSEMANAYASLYKKGGAVSAGESNIGNIIAGTDIGQVAGRAIGSEAQVMRDLINTMTPNIINVIRQSTEMGAKGMDTPKELEFYLRALGDVNLPIEASIKALDTLDKIYGKGETVPKMLKDNPALLEKVKKSGLKFGEEEKKTDNTSGSLFIEDEEIRRDLEEFRKRQNK